MIRRLTVAMVVLALAGAWPAGPARASCPPCAGCIGNDCTLAAWEIEEAHFDGRGDLSDELGRQVNDHREWLTRDFFDEHILPAQRLDAQQRHLGWVKSAEEELKRVDADVAANGQAYVRRETYEAQESFTPVSDVTPVGIGATAMAHIKRGPTVPGPEVGAGGEIGLICISGLPGCPDASAVIEYITQTNCTPGLTPLCQSADAAQMDPLRGMCGPGGPATLSPEELKHCAVRGVTGAMAVRMQPSPRQLAEEPESLLTFATNGLWQGAARDSEEAYFGLVAPIEDNTYAPHVEAMFPNTEIAQTMGAEGADGPLYSKLGTMHAASIGVEQTMARVLPMASEEEAKRAELVAVTLQNIIRYEIMRSKQRQELLMAGILMYEVVKHRRWRAEQEALRLARGGQRGGPGHLAAAQSTEGDAP